MSSAHEGDRILGSLGSADGKGLVRMQHRLESDVGDVWSALTDPARLAVWYGEGRTAVGRRIPRTALFQRLGGNRANRGV